MSAEGTSERHPLREVTRPQVEDGAPSLTLVDLFAGCGGITLGISQAAHDHGIATDVALAVDFETTAIDVYRTNFPDARRVELAPVEEFFDGALGTALTFRETRTRESTGAVDVLVGGPRARGTATSTTTLGAWMRRTRSIFGWFGLQRFSDHACCSSRTCRQF
ncbi:DNA cytosine methyltransferase [Microbacterium aurugineum]